MSRAVWWCLPICLSVSLTVSAHVYAAGHKVSLDELTAERTAMADTFLAAISDCVKRRDTDAPLFHGCSDWSSAVEGYWAITAVARVTNAGDLLAAVKTELTPDLIEKER